MSLPLTKTCDPVADFALLPKELALVDVFFHADAPQHELRRWEYALALDAVCRWEHDRQAHVAYDVGGAGSPFHRILGHEIGTTVRVIDPQHSLASTSLEQFVSRNPALADVVTCLSVLEHVEDLDRFLYYLGCLVAPGGLLFLTMDCWNTDGPDTAHFYWDRKRIFTPYSWPACARLLHDFNLFGKADWSYHDDQLYGSYSFASLALQKRS